MKRGTIVLTEFPYTDLSASKRRPTYRVFIPTEDAVVGFIFTQMQQENKSVNICANLWLTLFLLKRMEIPK